MKKLNIPGPKAKEVLIDDEKFISPYGRPSYKAVIEKGKGVWVWDVDGNKLLDFSSGIAVCSTGHCHPEVVRAIEEQAETLLHISETDFYCAINVTLAKKLSQITPGKFDKRIFFSNSGAESIEAAMKLARWSTKRQMFLAFYSSFHGRTYGAMSLTSSKKTQREGFGPLVPGVVHVHYPYCYRCPFNLKYPECDFSCIKYIEDEVLKRVAPPHDVAAMFVEPIQGEGGYIVPPDGYLKKLKALLEKHGILYVDDEVQAGIGRTGKMFAIEHWGIIPDIICSAKALASGMPIGVTISKREIMDWPKGAHASTFGGNPVSCAAALATLKLMEDSLVENARVMGEYFMTELKKLEKQHRMIGDVRGKGLMLACELVRDRTTKEKAIEETDKVLEKCFEYGLMVLSCGENTIRFIPPLIVTKEEIDIALDIFSTVLKEIEK
ncbi:MAG: acetyl ornithine aminotransferase family protein [bacterium]